MSAPETVCFRVTRVCNARCGFCLAPPDGNHPDLQTLKDRVDRLVGAGVRRLHFCGGEPTVHPGLGELLAHVQRLSARARVTTNGLRVGDALIAAMRAADAEVKVSIHGDAQAHDALVGRPAFAPALGALRRLRDAGVDVGVQTTLVAGGQAALSSVSRLCVSERIGRWSVIPFIPRGLGRDRRSDYGLSDADKRAARAEVAELRRSLRGRVEVRWLDFATRPVPVMEADGRLLLEGATEALDQELSLG